MFNLRFLLISLGVVVLIGGGVGGWWWWSNRPEYLYSSAQSNFNKAEEALGRQDNARARDYLENAYQSLHLLTSEKRNPKHVPGLMLNREVAGRLSGLVEDEKRKMDLANENWECLIRAAQSDPKHADAQYQAMQNLLQRGKVLDAYSFANNLANLKKGENTDGEWKGYATQQIIARYVLAYTALHGPGVKRPQEALQVLQEAEELGRQEGQSAATRWRMAVLEAQALEYQVAVADQAKKKTGTSMLDRDKHEKTYQTALGQLRAVLQSLTERAFNEADQPLPEQGKLPNLPTIASMAVSYSQTDTPPLIDVLLMGIRQGTDYDQVRNRAEVAIKVCEKLLAGGQPPPNTVKEVSRCLGSMDQLAFGRIKYLIDNEKQPSRSLLKDPVWLSLTERTDKLNEKVKDFDVGGDPIAYLGLAQQAARGKRPDAALRFAEKGLDVIKRIRQNQAAAAQGKQLTNVELELRTMAAWVLLSQHKLSQAQPHLDALRNSNSPQFLASTSLMEGLIAIQDGRLDYGVRQLERAGSDPRKVLRSVGLATGYMALGQYEKAVPQLEQVATYYAKLDELPEDVRAIVEQLLPNPVTLNLEFVRCYLGLNKFDLAVKAREKLRDLPEWQTATNLLSNYLLRQANQPGVAQAEQKRLLDAANALLAQGRQANADDPRFVWGDISILLRNREVNVPVVASALAGAAGFPATVGPLADAGLVVENYRLLKGLNWHLEKAEKLLAAYVKDRPRNLQAQLAWVRWLQITGRLDSAIDYLTNMADVEFRQQRQGLQLMVAQMRLRRGESEEVNKILQQLEGTQADNLSVQMVRILNDIATNPNDPDALTKAQQALKGYEANGTAIFFQAQLAQMRGDFAQALDSYDRSVEFANFKAASQRGIYESLQGLRRKASVKEAHEKARELLDHHPDDPMILLVFAELAAQADDIQGDRGMQGALAHLENILTKQAQNQPNLSPALGAYFRSRGWIVAGRPDLARQDADRAINLDKKHLASRLMAAQLAYGDEDWDACLQHARVLEELQPQLDEARLWQARAQAQIGRKDEARKLFEDLLRKHTQSDVVYAELVNMAHRENNFPLALDWARKWRAQRPIDANALQAEIHLLAVHNRLPEALEVAEKFVGDQTKRLTRELTEQFNRLGEPPSREERERRERLLKYLPLQQQVAIMVQITGGLKAAQAYEPAEAWATRAVNVANQLEAGNKQGSVLTAQLLLAEVHMLRARQEVWPFLRPVHVNKAIEIYSEVYKAVPNDLISGNNLAWLLTRERGEAEAALAIVNRVREGAHSRKPISGDRLPLEFLDTLGVVYLEAKKYEDARKLFEEAVSRYKDEPRVLMHLGRAYAGVKNNSKAIQNLNAASRIALVKADRTTDPNVKSKLLAVAEEARQAGQGLTNR